MSGVTDCQLETGPERGTKEKTLHFVYVTISHCENLVRRSGLDDSLIASDIWGDLRRVQAASEVWPLRCGSLHENTYLRGKGNVPSKSSKKEDRKWARLQLAIPVFIRTGDGSGKDSLEFATAVNISAGGALVVVRRSLPKSTAVSLEIPSAPIGPADGLKTSSRIMHAKTVWVRHLDDYHLLGLKFARPLNTDTASVSGKHM